jgi:hypothetical protein
MTVSCYGTTDKEKHEVTAAWQQNYLSENVDHLHYLFAFKD